MAKDKHPIDSATKENSQRRGGSNAARKKRRGYGYWSFVRDFLTAIIWLGIFFAGATAYFAYGLPNVDEVAAMTRRPGITVVAVGGEQLGSFGSHYGDVVAVKNLPPHVPAAVLAVEDRRFYEHGAVDVRGVLRAIYANLKARRIVQGGSTITQQVAKNLFLTPERKIARKIRELLLAFWLERKFTKDQILNLYLNRVYLGAGTYGIQAAAKRYFDRSARDVSVFQAAMLAGLLKAPSRYNPARDPDLARRRAEVVLNSMVAAGYLTRTSAIQAAAEKTHVSVTPPTGRGRYFSDWILSQVADYVGPVADDLTIVTTLDYGLQKIAEDRLTDYLNSHGLEGHVSQGAVVVLDVDGAVRAMVGGRDYGISQFNRAAQALRQPGSAFKPFVYLAGLEQGLTPDDVIEDGPISIDGWRPRNFSNTYEGYVTLQRALSKSLNTAAVRVARIAGVQAIGKISKRLGVKGSFGSDLSVALGTAEVTLLDLTAGYVPFANGGLGIWPFGIQEIRGRDGVVYYRRSGEGPGRVVDVPRVAMMNRMLASVILEGTGKAALINQPVAGKTGTSQDFRDAWFVGYTAHYVAGIWVGNDDGSATLGVTGGSLPANIWREIMAPAHHNLSVQDLPGLSNGSPGRIKSFWRRLAGD